MNTAQFILPPHSPLQRVVRARPPKLSLIVGLVLTAHVALLGSLLTRGFVRQNTSGIAVPEPPGLPEALALVRTGTGGGQGTGVGVGISQPMPNAPGTSPAIQAAQPDPAAGPDTSVYLARPGDTLSKIARAHGVSIQALREANDLRSDRLAVGQPLKVPTP